ncbi:hypothetical protein BDZ85DRAFT_270083 [Elsinoe ampelina]|uniref:Radical SAM core domain-containing protein n=1 Tax=Elsinoe ampelina TaxID=302913 RepID=A0A6A6FYW2_9PEZI|nr:hypothetical protein BDZ85DRAFT_270083 [Elsinoe ampelina]
MAVSRTLRPSLCALRPLPCRISLHPSRLSSTASTSPSTEPISPPIPPLTPAAPLDRRSTLRSAPPFSSFLTDIFGRQHDYLRISLTERCNLRCTYCMPSAGVPLSPDADLLTTPEIVYLSSLFVAQGVRKIRLTGGEPTVRGDFMDLLGQIGGLKSKGLRELAITTNGLMLERKVEGMVERGLTGVNVSLDTLEEGMFEIMTRRMGWGKVMRGIERVLEMNQAGAGVKLKVNCVVMRGVNDGEVVDFVEMTRDKDLEVRFIEYMPFDGNKWAEKKMVGYMEMVERIRARYPGLRRVGDGRNETSKTWEVEGFKGKIGFITSMTHNFCGTCNRLRITSDGNLKVCLFGNSEVSLRDMMRRDNEGRPMDEEAFEAVREIEMNRRQGLVGVTGPPAWIDRETELLNIIGMAVKRKKEKHAGMGQLENMKNRPMILIDESQKSIAPSNRFQPFSRGWPLAGTALRPFSIPLHLLGQQHPSLGGGAVRYLSNRYSRPPVLRRRGRSGVSMPNTQSVDERFTSDDDIGSEQPRPAHGQDGKHDEPTNAHTSTHSTQEARGLGIIRKHPVGRRFSAPRRSHGDHFDVPLSRGTRTATRAIPKGLRTRRNFPAFSDTPSDPVSEISPDDTATWTKSTTEPPTPPTPTPPPSSPVPPHPLTHISPTGTVSMVNISSKPSTPRLAIARGHVTFSNAGVVPLIATNSLIKGNVLTTAQIAGIQAAKRTSDLIPLCHPIPLTHVHVDVVPRLHPDAEKSQTRWRNIVDIVAVVSTTGATGVEMEALAAVVGAGLTVVDMCKAVDKRMKIQGVAVVGKAGGRSGVYVNNIPVNGGLVRDLVERGIVEKGWFEEVLGGDGKGEE